MGKRNYILFWATLTALTFGFFRWLFGIAIPEIAMSFSLGTTVIVVSGLFIGRTLSLLAIRMKAGSDWSAIVVWLIGVGIVDFILIAFLLNAMIAETTFFSFAVTILLLFLLMAAIGAIVTIVRHQYKSRVLNARAAIAQSKSELQLLQSQLSPHFLFNTLNNLYGLSLTSPERVPLLLLKLSELLRYSVYDVREMFVPLQSEVEYLQNYIEFEKIRLGERLRLQVAFDQPLTGECKIAPLLLVVFVENAFKHSRNTTDEIISIDIKLQQIQNSIVFSVKNSCAATQHRTQKHSGFGLESVRKRLAMLYAGKHDLQVDNPGNEFSVKLILSCQ